MSTSDQPKKDLSEMNASELSMRKFLKALGVTTHKKLEATLNEAVKSGKVTSGSQITITAKIVIEEFDFNHEIEAQLTAPER